MIVVGVALIIFLSPPVYVGGWIETLGWSLYSQPLTVVATGVRRWLD